MRKAILTTAIFISSVLLFAQPTPPGGGYQHGVGGNQQPGGGAPIDGGFSILLAMGAIYATKKIYSLRKTEE